MSVQHFKSLLFKSAQIEEEIVKEQSRPRPDWMRLLKLKKIRLSIKDKLYRIAQKGRSSSESISEKYKRIKPALARSARRAKRYNKLKGA